VATNFKTLTFPNTPKGQKQKNEALQREISRGWEVVSETITQGKFRGADACCLFIICAPLAFCAGYSDGTINVTLKRETFVSVSKMSDRDLIRSQLSHIRPTYEVVLAP